MKENRHSGVTIGIFFTIGSLLLLFTIVPLISVMQGAIFENISKTLLADSSSRSIGGLTIFLLAFCLTSLIFLSFWYNKTRAMRKQPVSIRNIIVQMAAFYFFVHPLGFYIYWELALDFRGDGQLIFAVTDSFPYSSFYFIVFGVLIDKSRKYQAAEDS